MNIQKIRAKYCFAQFDKINIGDYCILLNHNNAYGLVLAKNKNENAWYSSGLELKILTNNEIYIETEPERVIKLELSGQINKAKIAIMEAKLKLL